MQPRRFFCGSTTWESIGRKQANNGSTSLPSPTRLRALLDVPIVFVAGGSVAIGTDESPVSVSKTGDARRKVIVWVDHRAVDQAERINACKSPVLQFASGSLSPEHQAPKLLWVKENLQESWAIAFWWMAKLMMMDKHLHSAEACDLEHGLQDCRCL